MRHLHTLGIVHRDLKPENICFTTAELQWVKLIDLGAAGFLEHDGMTDLCGTPLYAAPEVTPRYTPLPARYTSLPALYTPLLPYFMPEVTPRYSRGQCYVVITPTPPA